MENSPSPSDEAYIYSNLHRASWYLYVARKGISPNESYSEFKEFSKLSQNELNAVFIELNKK